MLNQTIDDLKVKPIAKNKPDFNIIIKLPQEAKMPNIIDKTKDKLIDRESFFHKLQDKLDIQQTDKSQKKPLTDSKPLDKQESIFKFDSKKSEPEINTTIKVESLETITNIVKTNKKLIIQQPQEKELAESKIDLPSKERLTPKPPKSKIETINETIILPKDLRFGRTLYINRIPKQQPNVLIKAPNYYLNNREIFISFINSLFEPYKQELLKQEQDIKSGKISIDCNQSGANDFSLLIHQKIVRDYINIYTPYRGLLLYHGLGSGKTCSSIAIAEGIKNDRKIMVLTPASLRDNYIEELKKCGDYLYKKNQFWEFISLKSKPENLEYLSSVLKLPQEYIKKNDGAWFINVTKQPNYETLGFEDQTKINEQINKMISFKYEFINYNGLRSSHLTSLSLNNTINPFSNKVIIIDEAHNFISRIVNKLNRKSSMSMKLYNYLMEAENCKIVLLTGTPIINYPNEIAILFNILRGSIHTFSCKLIPDKKKLTTELLNQYFKRENLDESIDTLEYNATSYTLKITKNPFGYISKEKNKVEYTTASLTREQFKANLENCLKKNNIGIVNSKITIESYKLLPDKFETFKNLFINPDNTIKNQNMFRMRILGLTSYFRSAQEQLMPRFNKLNQDDFKVIEIPMSDFQFGIYEEARAQERKLEDKNKKNQAKKPKAGADSDDVYSDTVSTYRIFSRAFCNFVFPKPDIKRPMPNNNQTIESNLKEIENADKLTEDIIEVVKPEEKVENIDGKYEADDITNLKQQGITGDSSYQKRLEEALNLLEINSNKYLSKQALLTYSPKYLNILENIVDSDHEGIHLLYSQFKTLEGIGIFKLVLKENNFAEFKIKKNSKGEYILNVDEKDIGKPMFASYTGSETSEEREIIKNVLNSNWKLVPSTITQQISARNLNNFNGEIIKVLMITSSGAEGISLKNVRFVHITEPYWHPVRIEQVIGRARRICSHSDLPIEKQDVKVFLYLMKLSDEQLKSDSSIELRLKDVSKREKGKIVTSDQLLYEISLIKEEINHEILKNVKESAIDCSIHTRAGSKDNVKCFVIGNPSANNLTYLPDINLQDKDTAMELNKKKETLQLVELKIKGVTYAYDQTTKMLYDYDSYLKQELLLVGKIEEQPDKTFKVKKI
tara:strand:- start:2371 stop:5766 length:3396 start_codon:yes stop_codon:yes gene_type:complete